MNTPILARVYSRIAERCGGQGDRREPSPPEPESRSPKILGITLAVGTPLLATILVATTFFAAAVLADTLLAWEGEDMSFSSPEVKIVKNNPETWSGGAVLKYTGVAAPQYSIAVSQAGDYSVTIRGKAKSDLAAPGAWPIVEVYRNNALDPANRIATFTVDTITLNDFTASVAIPQDTTKILVKASSNMAGDQVFWLDNISLKHIPDTTPPQTTINSGPSFASTSYNDDPSFSFSSSEPNSTFECKLDSGSWVSCTSPKSYSGLANGEHAFSVRAIDQSGNVDVSPETRQWRVWQCSGKHIVPGNDLDALVNADSSTVATTFCIHAGTYAIDRTINVRTGDKLLGEEGATTTRGPATYPTDPPVNIKNGTNLTRLVQLEGASVTLKWLDVSGAQSLHNADGSPKTGSGIAIGGGEADDTNTTIMQYLRVHDNDANGIGSPRGEVLNSEFFRNTLDPVFLGYAGAAVKGIYEYEAAYNFVHDEQGNGLWCDRNCSDQDTQPNGFWVHHNLLVNNDRYGVRYEHSPAFLDPGLQRSQPSALVEYNRIHANGYGGTAMQDAQNGVFRYNTFGQATIDGVFYAHNGAGPKAMQFSEGNKTTSLYNAKAYGNTLGGEYIQGCSMSDEIVSCFENN